MRTSKNRQKRIRANSFDPKGCRRESAKKTSREKGGSMSGLEMAALKGESQGTRRDVTRGGISRSRTMRGAVL